MSRANLRSLPYKYAWEAAIPFSHFFLSYFHTFINGVKHKIISFLSFLSNRHLLRCHLGGRRAVALKGFSIQKVVSCCCSFFVLLCYVLIVSSQFHFDCKTTQRRRRRVSECLVVLVGLIIIITHAAYIDSRWLFELHSKLKKRNEKKTAAIQRMMPVSKTGFSSRLIFVFELRRRERKKEEQVFQMRYRHLSYRAAIWHLLLPFAFRLQQQQHIATTASWFHRSKSFLFLFFSSLTVFQDCFALYTNLPPFSSSYSTQSRPSSFFFNFLLTLKQQQTRRAFMGNIYIKLTILIELECPFWSHRVFTVQSSSPFSYRT